MISIVIPTYNEEEHIKATIQKLWEYNEANLIKEIIVADGGSTDNTRAIAKSEGVMAVICPKKGRAVQMNYGASYTKENILYFLHADTIPPKNFANDIATAVDKGFYSGCYRLSFDRNHWFLKANAWFTRFDIDAFRFGDQSLFVTREAFNSAGGFCEKHIVMEDQEIIKRLKRHGNFIILPEEVITSARKYAMNGVFKMQGIFYLLYFMYQLGYSQEKLLRLFRKLVLQDKL